MSRASRLPSIRIEPIPRILAHCWMFICRSAQINELRRTSQCSILIYSPTLESASASIEGSLRPCEMATSPSTRIGSTSFTYCIGVFSSPCSTSLVLNRRSQRRDLEPFIGVVHESVSSTDCTRRAQVVSERRSSRSSSRHFWRDRSDFSRATTHPGRHDLTRPSRNSAHNHPFLNACAPEPCVGSCVRAFVRVWHHEFGYADQEVVLEPPRDDRGGRDVDWTRGLRDVTRLLQELHRQSHGTNQEVRN